jgi:hypothetical protein
VDQFVRETTEQVEAQLSRTTGSPPLGKLCPACGTAGGFVIVTTPADFYYQCTQCQYLWLEPNMEPEQLPGGHRRPRRRKTDL